MLISDYINILKKFIYKHHLHKKIYNELIMDIY